MDAHGTNYHYHVCKLNLISILPKKKPFKDMISFSLPKRQDALEPVLCSPHGRADSVLYTLLEKEVKVDTVRAGERITHHHYAFKSLDG
jgi:hypothetical protein